jgi:hypothetical protein
LFFSVLFAVVSVPPGASEGSVEDVGDLKHFQWKNRVLLVFAPTRGEPSFEALRESLVGRNAEIVDRDLVVFELIETGPSTKDGQPLDPEAARLLRERFRTPSGTFSVVLVGKDGGVKLDRQEKTSLDEIFALIDSMPMRQREMRSEHR